MRMNRIALDLETWVRHYAEENIFEHNGKIIDSEKAFCSAGLHAQAKPNYDEWLASRT